MFEDTVKALIDRVIRYFQRKGIRKFIFWILVLGFIALLLESKGHVLSSIGNKNDVQVLAALLELENKGIMDSRYLSDEYLALVGRYRNQTYSCLGQSLLGIVRPSSPQERLAKFLTGSMPLCIFALAFTIFSGGPFKTRITAGALLLFIALAIGAFSMIIPTFASPLVNYIGSPVLQIVLVIAAALRTSAKSKATAQAK